MYYDPHTNPRPERSLRPDRRPLPRSGEIRLRVKRTLHRGEA
jgi:hypothetical protein